MSYNEERMFDFVNKHSDHRQISEYIISNFGVTSKEAEKIAEYLMSNNFNKYDILDGFHDEYIVKWMGFEKTRELSVKKDGEKITRTPLRTKKKPVAKNIITIALAGIMFASLVVGYPKLKNNKGLDVEISEDLSRIAYSDSFEYEHGSTIVAQNTYTIGHDENGYPIVAYDNEKIAKDIITICAKNPELLDLCLSITYFDMNHNRLKNMDEVLVTLQKNMSNDESLQLSYDKIDDCQVFLDYMFNRGFISPNDKEYSNIQVAIEEYKNAKSVNGAAYNDLSEESQKSIQELVKELKENTGVLCQQYKDTVNELLTQNNLGGR